MSIELMTASWKLSGLTPTQKFVLIALADNANDDGVCWPSLTRIAEKCSLSRTAVTEALAALQHAGHITRDPGNVRRTTHYLVHPKASTPNVLGRQTDGPSAPGGLGVVRQADGGSTPGGLKSSINHQLEPPENRERAREIVSRGTGAVPYQLLMKIRGLYPQGDFGDVHWLDAERAIGQLLEEGEPVAELVAAAGAYAAQQTAKGNTTHIRSPSKFYREGYWRGPFPIPAKPENAMQRLMRLNGGTSTTNDSRVIDHDAAAVIAG